MFRKEVNLMTFGQTLSKLRTSHNVTQAELSEYLKISKSLISMYERDKRNLALKF